ncbi:hypothetical protein SHIRM173S_11169 [Streptomyces hirsutus]
MKPRRASPTAITASREARPACIGLVIVPKFARLPEAWEAAMPRAWAVTFPSRSSRRQPAAVAASRPVVEVLCQPRP